jgi:hypothetical protein
MRKWSFSVWLVLVGLIAHGQTTYQGQITDISGNLPIELVTIFFDGDNLPVESDQDGRYRITTASSGAGTLVFSRLGYEELKVSVSLNNRVNTLDVQLTAIDADIEVTITDNRIDRAGITTNNAEAIRLLPSTTGNLESVLPHIALGARSGSGGELTSQYNVRGGNYDENLVYVNDFEIFRPQLIRAGQQEGLSFPNIDLIRDLSFSSGGYESRYGDRMSSVLDIKYKRPEEFKGSLSGSLLGGSTHIEGSKVLGKSDYQKLRYLVGARYKTNRYLLGSLDTQGEYNPDFVDIQAYLTYDVTREIQIGLLSNYNRSDFNFIPRTRNTALGLIQESLQLTTIFEGEEDDSFRTGMVGASITYIPDRERNPTFLKLLASTYRGVEEENIDIRGFYRLSQVEGDISSDNFGEEIAVLGTGTEHDFSRNRLFNTITNVQLKGGLELQNRTDEGKSHFLQYGVKYQSELFDDRLNEWVRIDSAGFSLPFNPTQVLLDQVLKSENEIRSTKITGFIQDTYSNFHEGRSDLSLTVGTRFSYWDLPGVFNVSPRAQLLYKPASGSDGTGTTYKFSTGVYYQTPFYRELRRPDGTINTDIRPQRSLHFVGGLTKDFLWKKLSNKPFRFIAEAYYKSFSDLISYNVDNVRLRYSGENDATGSALGLDLRLNGEFVPGAESWFNLSYLRARESITDVQHQRRTPEGEVLLVDDVPRPSDQAFSMSIFFQDYLPANENIRVFLNLNFSTGLPFGLPDAEANREFRNIFRFTPYRRVDMGFGLQLWKKEWLNEKPGHLLRSFDNAWLNLEVFNLLGVANQTSNTWIRTVFSQQFAVPDNLTNRRVNLKFRVDF